MRLYLHFTANVKLSLVQAELLRTQSQLAQATRDNDQLDAAKLTAQMERSSARQVLSERIGNVCII